MSHLRYGGVLAVPLQDTDTCCLIVYERNNVHRGEVGVPKFETCQNRQRLQLTYDLLLTFNHN